MSRCYAFFAYYREQYICQNAAEILRMFSKIYGMAGMVAATASLKIPTLVPERRKINKDIREDVFSFLVKKNMPFVPSESNCFMVDVKKPGADVVKAMAAEKVYIGRVWPAWPTHVRVTVGTATEMEKFKTALNKVLT